MDKQKEVMLHFMAKDERTPLILEKALQKGFHLFLCDEPTKSLKKAENITVFSPSGDGDVLVVTPEDIDSTIDSTREVKPFAVQLCLRDKRDESKATEAGRSGATAVLVETEDWRIIPLENLVAELHREDTKLFAKIDSIEEVETMFNVLELGVDGVVLSPKSPEDIDKLTRILGSAKYVELLPAKVIQKRRVGVGDRICIDTASILERDEGMLVGSQSNLLFFINGETIGSKFSAPRPFRVNAGPVHSYVLMANGKTKYLSELECGDSVLLFNRQGLSKTAVVGRVKIEKRPLCLVKVECGDRTGKILVQNAETIRFADTDGTSISVTDLKTGDEVLVHITGEGGRHFGTEVDEFVIER